MKMANHFFGKVFLYEKIYIIQKTEWKGFKSRAFIYNTKLDPDFMSIIMTADAIKQMN